MITGQRDIERVATTWSEVVLCLRPRVGGRVRVATLGPLGTSADHVARGLVAAVNGAFPVDVSLLADFKEAKVAVLDGRADVALVPSAFQDATSFHWHPRLDLVASFVHRTPDYGLAVDAGAPYPERIVLASMPEVRDLFEQLAPAEIQGRLAETVPTPSTSSAAARVRAGGANMAVCNDMGRQVNGLEWFRVRRGVPIVWMLFSLARTHGTDDGDLR